MIKGPATPGVFLLGVGAQKAGTSWLHQQLHSRPDADFGVLKEYHVHDARTVPELARFRRLNVAIGRPGSWIQPRSWLRQWFIRKPQRYVDYFTWLLQRPRLRSGPVRLTGDITPSYALLSAATLGEIRDAFTQRGIPVRPVFLMRDPIERLISSQRMKLRKQGCGVPPQKWPPCANGWPKGADCAATTARPSTLSIRPLAWSTALLACSKPCSHHPPTQSSATSLASPTENPPGERR